MPEPLDKIDAAIAGKLTEVTPPPDLRARLLALAAEPEEAPATAGWWTRGIAAVAAALVIALAVLSLWPRFASHAEPVADATRDMAAFLSGGFALEMQTPDVDKVRQWLVSRNPKHPVDLPVALARNPTLGCRELSWRGHAGSLACFRMKGGGEAHLAMFPSSAFSDAPGAKPQIASAGAWTSAAWSKEGMTYMLFVPAGRDPMEELAALFRAQPNIASSKRRSTACALANVSAGVARMVPVVCT